MARYSMADYMDSLDAGTAFNQRMRRGLELDGEETTQEGADSPSAGSSSGAAEKSKLASDDPQGFVNRFTADELIRRLFSSSTSARKPGPSGRVNPRRFHPTLHIYRPHQGTDFGASTGTPIHAFMAGKVTGVHPNAGGAGNYIVITSGDYQHVYMHLSKFAVVQGIEVKQGQHIGDAGNTGGISTGSHLHFELWLGKKGSGTYIDPLVK